jgi:hypothetical protein
MYLESSQQIRNTGKLIQLDKGHLPKKKAIVKHICEKLPLSLQNYIQKMVSSITILHEHHTKSPS